MEMESDPRDEREAASGWGRDGKFQRRFKEKEYKLEFLLLLFQDKRIDVKNPAARDFYLAGHKA